MPRRSKISPANETVPASDLPPITTNPDENPEILDGKTALRASPDADEKGESFDAAKVGGDGDGQTLRNTQGNGMWKGKGKRAHEELEGVQEGVDEVGAAILLGPSTSTDPTPTKRARTKKSIVKTEPTPATPSDPELSEPDVKPPMPTGTTSEPIPFPAGKKRKNPTKASLAAKKGQDEIKAFIASQQQQQTQNGTSSTALTASPGPKLKTPKRTPTRTTTPFKREPNASSSAEDPDRAALRDPEADGDAQDEQEDVDVVKREAGRSPPVNSDYLPLPWKGRLGYACLNTYLRFSNPPIFSSRTCRIASILEHRHPLPDPTQPSHPTKNRPDKTQPASMARGQAYVESIGLANARDIIKMMRWNERYGIRFLRLSSEMFPFASHGEYGYSLVGFASETLEEVGKVAAELGHRLTTHPGQFTQLGSPRAVVIENAMRDLVYHDELLSLLKLPPQQDRDAVCILHLGGVFGDKAATVERFKENYLKLPQRVKNRLVLENDDVSWSVHDLLPICEELNIPMVLDYHHHNIIFDADQLREGTKDIMDLYPRITATWTKKGITQKMHYSEPTPQAVTGRQRRKHNPRPFTLPPCAPDMDLMIEAKDKEQAVFELMRNFRLPGWDSFSNIIPYERADDNKPDPKKAKKKKTKKQLKAEEEDPSLVSDEEPLKAVIPEDEVGMGGPEGRVYWPPTMEEWLRPKKREVKKKDDKTQEDVEKEALAKPTPMNLAIRQEAKKRLKAEAEAKATGESADVSPDVDMDVKTPVKNGKAKTGTPRASTVKKVKKESTPDLTDEEEADLTDEDHDGHEEAFDMSGSDEEAASARPAAGGWRQSSRKTSSKRKSYAEADPDEEMSS